jgi:YVTN family beta-propeller protein
MASFRGVPDASREESWLFLPVDELHQDLPGRGPIASVPNWVTFTPDSKTIHVSNAAIKSVTAIDTVSMKVKAVIPVGEVPKRIGTLVLN